MLSFRTLGLQTEEHVSVPAVLTLGARRELAVALQRIAEDNADAAEQLNDAVHEAACLIGANPRSALADCVWPAPATASGRSRASAISWPTPTRPTRLELCGSCIPRETSRACWRNCSTEERGQDSLRAA